MYALLITALIGSMAYAAPKKTTDGSDVSFQFRDAQISDVLGSYAKMTGQKFIIDPGIKGKITILNPEKISAEEAFNMMSTSLAMNGVAISEQGDAMVVMQARQVQRDLIPVVTELPNMKPERMVSWVIETRHIDADDVNRQMRNITSNNGEVFTFGKNKLVVTDWVTNLYRVRDMMAQLDKPGYQSPKGMEKHVATAKENAK